MEKVKEKIYKYLVDSDIRIKSHYEGYIISNPEYHKEHRLESYKFLFALRNYYKKWKRKVSGCTMLLLPKISR